MCDRVAVINKGKIVKIEEIAKDKQEENSNESIITVKQLKEAERILKENNYNIEIKEDKLHIKILHDDVPEVIKLLAKNNIDIYNVIQKEKTLEDIFFDATEKSKMQKDGE